MSVKPLFGTDRTIPEDGATNWGQDVRELLEDIVMALNGMSAMTTNDLPFLVLKGTDTTVTADLDLDVTSNRHDVVSSGGALNLGSLSITTPEPTDGQTLLLVGQDNTNTVELDSDDGTAGNWVINGDMILGSNDAIFLSYDTSINKWVEISRNN
tara:strand:+ start:369 stop:833 length:465 start_codon:yes stop_codon:yes gene_type:complete